ncbi:uncharacterized protein LOC125777138 [Bactrocera dorsalis]|uniref:Uncharacterized protein LOC125777138 n=1 Tax=Bactrocera dorsalis TaxID=27457 RepID=A0ABM3JDM8_BACDO|nr:uncharacterized protein LOC125777138 [Bactrocera dorsalis]
MGFGIPIIWIDPQGHHTGNCYACKNKFARLNKRNTVHKSVQSAQLPVSHSENVPIPRCPSPTDRYISPTFSTEPTDLLLMYNPTEVESPCRHLEISQARLNTMVRHLKLSQRQAICLAHHLRSVNTLSKDVKVYGYRKRQEELLDFFEVNGDNTFSYCKNIPGLMQYMNCEYKPEQWLLFIDSSKNSLKAVLLYVDNTKNPVPIAISSNTKETYEAMKFILDRVQYQQHQWKICADLKVIALLTGLQTGYTKNMCFICHWDTRYRANQYRMRDWKLRTEFHLNVANVIHIPLVPANHILPPLLHIKLGIVKNFIKAINRDAEAFKCLTEIFPRLSVAKIKGVLNGPDIIKLMKNAKFGEVLRPNEKIAASSD